MRPLQNPPRAIRRIVLGWARHLVELAGVIGMTYIVLASVGPPRHVAFVFLVRTIRRDNTLRPFAFSAKKNTHEQPRVPVDGCLPARPESLNSRDKALKHRWSALYLTHVARRGVNVSF
jgi:hypothetical protein